MDMALNTAFLMMGCIFSLTRFLSDLALHIKLGYSQETDLKKIETAQAEI